MKIQKTKTAVAGIVDLSKASSDLYKKVLIRFLTTRENELENDE